MPEQLLSTDPGAGRLLSADPAAGSAPLPPSQFPRDAQGRLAVGGSEDNPSDLMTMLFHAAHPQTVDDFARLLGAPVDSIRKAAAGALALQAAKGGVASLKSGASAAWEGTKELASRVQVHPSALLDFKLNQPLQVLKNAVTLAPKVGAEEGAISSPGYPRLVQTPAAPQGSVVSPPGPVAPPMDAPAPAPSAGPSLPSGAPMRGELPKELIEARGLGTTPAVLNDLAIQARRAGIKLTQPEYQAAADLITKQDVTPQQAVSALARMRSGLSPGKLMLSAEETPVWQKLVKDGSTPSEATDAVLGLRKLKTSLGTPSTAEVTASVADRNATGRWNK